MKYIDAEKLIAKLRKHLMPTVLDRNYDEWEHGKDAGLQQAISIVESLQREHPEDIVAIAKTFLDALSKTPYNNKPITDAQTIVKQLLVFLNNPKLYNPDALSQQERPRSKFVKVRCVFPFDETWEKDKIYTCEVWHHGDLNRNFWDVYYDYGKDPKYVQFPTIESLNEEFAIIQDESQVIQEQPEVDLEKEIGHWMDKLDDKYCTLIKDYSIQDIKDTARHFWNKGYNAKKEEK